MRAAVPWVLFLTLFTAYAYFHQGGGWNQNSRFDQVRALVEDGSWSIHRFALYRARGDGWTLERVPLPERVKPLEIAGINSLDVALAEGRLYPNKPPGTTLLALPAYAVAWWLGRLLGAAPESWRTLTLNFYLATVFSIGLASALGGVALWRLSRRLHPGVAEPWHVAAALACGLGTILWPFSTMLFDHAAAAAAGIAGFLFVVEACEASAGRAARLAAAGFVLGLGVLVSYTVVLIIPLIALYALARLRREAGSLAYFVAGGVAPAIFLLGYHWQAFGSPWTIANSLQLEIFGQSEERFLGVFARPDPGVLGELLVGRRRGLFASSPVLVLAIYGLYDAFRRRRLDPWVGAGVAVVYLLMNASFNAWHGGNSFGPRYLVPALPFLGLYLAPAFARWPRAGGALAAASAAIVLAATAADPQIASQVERPMLESVVPGYLGDDPVSRNPVGVYEGRAFTVFRRASFPARWNSFNLGELLFPGSAWSLLPLLALVAAGTGWLLRAADPRAGTPASTRPTPSTTPPPSR